MAGKVILRCSGHMSCPLSSGERREKYVALVRDKMVPEAARRKLAEYVDVFCEHGAFTMKETQEIFASAKEHGLGTRAHVCQLSEAALDPLEQFQPASYDHMDCVVDADVQSLARTNTIATLLPGANYFLGLRQISACQKTYRFGSGRGPGNGLQPWHIAHAEYAVRLVASLHADEDVAG